MRLNEYMLKEFPNLELREPLFYNWDTGIRFELGIDYDSDNIFENCPYIEEVYQRAVTLFKAIHSPNDDIYIVVDVDDLSDGKAYKHKLNFFSKYVKEKSNLFKLHQKTIPYICPEDDEEGECRTNRFTLKCKPSDIKYIPMLKAICNQDLGITPSIFHRVFFININKNTIFQVYDDRGCDLVATSSETIRGIYNTFNDWILDYDRIQIDKVFN